MRVLLVTTWQTACGIAEHSFYLKQAVEAADPGIEIVPSPEALDPTSNWMARGPVDVLHLNYQGALHSRWSDDVIARVRRTLGIPVVVTYHDTGVPNSEQCRSVCAAADAFVVHEPYDDLAARGHYWRMGVPAEQPAMIFERGARLWCGWDRPILGSIGFPFPWKNYDQLARITGEIGWALLLIAPGATADQIDRWRSLNWNLCVKQEFVGRIEAISLLTACDATAFMYVCHNTGQSGAILQGIAARKPVYALSTCRQFRALYADLCGKRAIHWVDTFEQLRDELTYWPITGRPHPPMVALAEQDSWARLGRQYAALYREVARG